MGKIHPQENVLLIILFTDSGTSSWQKRERLWVKSPVRVNPLIRVILDQRDHLD